MTLAKTKYANKVTAKGVGLEWLKKGTAKLVNKVARKELIKVSIGNIIKAGTKTAKGLLGLESAISIGFGIWDTIKGAKKIREGSSLSDEFRKAIGPLDEEKDPCQHQGHRGCILLQLSAVMRSRPTTMNRSRCLSLDLLLLVSQLKIQWTRMMVVI